MNLGHAGRMEFQHLDAEALSASFHLGTEPLERCPTEAHSFHGDAERGRYRQLARKDFRQPAGGGEGPRMCAVRERRHSIKIDLR